MIYAIPILLLVLTILAFFAIGRGNYVGFGVPQILLRVLVALPLLVSAILLHFLHASLTASIIPPAFPARTWLVIVTGLLEIAAAIGLFVPRARRPAAFWISIMMIAIFPANIYAAGKTIDGFQLPGVVPRTAMQIVYIALVLLAGYGLPKPVRRH
jgi:uncharacterized membrane protein